MIIQDSSADRSVMYGELAEWWPLLSAPADCADEATWYRDTLQQAVSGRAHTLLELGCGGGNNASHLRSWFELTLVDISADMLRVSEGLNPTCEHIQGDMRTVQLGRQFDCVLIHDAIMYMTTPADLSAAVTTAALHCRPGGAALFVPDFVRETFRPATQCGGHDGRDGRSLRYVSWVWDPDPSDSTCLVDFAFLVRDSKLEVRVLRDRHTFGLFAQQHWLDALRAAGFEPAPLTFKPADVQHPMTVFVGRKPA